MIAQKWLAGNDRVMSSFPARTRLQGWGYAGHELGSSARLSDKASDASAGKEPMRMVRTPSLLDSLGTFSSYSAAHRRCGGAVCASVASVCLRRVRSAMSAV